MKKLFLILSLLSIFISNVKSQIGNYCAIGDFSRTCYEFKEGNRFTCTEFMCTAIMEGQGKFKIEDDKIRFSYEKMPFYEEQFYIEKFKENKDEIEIEFSIIDYNTREKILEYSVFQEKKGRSENEINHIKNKVNLKYTGEPISLNISYPEYSNYTFQVTEGGQYQVYIFLRYGRERDIYEVKKGNEEFTIIEMAKDSITLRVERYNYELVLIKEEENTDK